MIKVIQSAAGSKDNSRRKGNFLVGEYTTNYGPSSETNFYNGIEPPAGGYTLYVDKPTGGPSITVFQNGTELLNFINSNYSANQSDVFGAIDWIQGQDGKYIDPNYFHFAITVSSGDSFTLPLVDDGTINFEVSWGDGSTNTITSYNQAETTHTYSSGGTYDIKINGLIKGFTTSNSADAPKIVDIRSWGALDISTSGAFENCVNLSASAVDSPKISTPSLKAAFKGCVDFNAPIGNWDLTAVQETTEMFFSASSFNQPVDKWDTRNVVKMDRMFKEAPAFNQPIEKWNTSQVTDMTEMFRGATSFNQPIETWNTTNVTEIAGMFYEATNFDNTIVDKWNLENVAAPEVVFTSPSNPFKMIVNVTSEGTFTLPLTDRGTPVNFTVDWGDGNTDTITSYNQAEATHTYPFIEDDGGGLTLVQGTQNWDAFGELYPGGVNGGYFIMGHFGALTEIFGGPVPDGTVFTLEQGGYTYTITPTGPYVFNDDFYLGLDPISVTEASGNTNPIQVQLYDPNTKLYVSGGEPSADYTIQINGVIDNLTYLGSNDASKIKNITQWGDLRIWTKDMFHLQPQISSLKTTAEDIPIITATDLSYFFGYQSNDLPSSIGNWDMSGVTNMSHMFDNASSFNQDISNWDVSNVTNMSYMFNSARSFNQNIGTWNTSNVTDMSYMFNDARVFNQNIGDWNVSNVTDMRYMFNNAEVFNNGGSPSINNWNTGNVTNMAFMFFNNYVFNQPIGNWDVSSVTDMEYMLARARTFNQNIGNWNVSNVTDMHNMFAGDQAFNNGGSPSINNWNPLNVTRMDFMFDGATVFNQPIGNWNVGNVTNMRYMFETAQAFDQNIGNWDVSSVTTMQEMFRRAPSFNNGGSPSINNWNTGNVSNMYRVFWQARKFNQPIGNWDVSNVTNMSEILNGCYFFNQDISGWDIRGLGNYYDIGLSATSLSTANYDALLIAWAALPPPNNIILYAQNSGGQFVVDGVTYNFTLIQYTPGGAAEAARNTLINTYGWSIYDDGPVS